MTGIPTLPVADRGLRDGCGRAITYLRLSVTDRCNFRCLYCMGEDAQFVARDRLLTTDELVAVAAAFCALGVTKLRLTGGEPLVRRDIVTLCGRMAALPGLQHLVLTTNGDRLEALARPLRAAGVERINVSLDSLDPARFNRITRGGDLGRVLRGIDAALAAGFERLKLNAVVVPGENDLELADIVAFAIKRGVNVSFIEEMPLGDPRRAGSIARYSNVQALEDIGERFPLVPTTETTGGPARYYRVVGTETRVGFISPHSHNFCATCNRVRVTAEGRLQLCLGNSDGLDLRGILRGAGDVQADLARAIRESLRLKPREHHFANGWDVRLARMNTTGG